MAIEYVPYLPETIDGQAVLSGFVRSRRLLRYQGADGVFNDISRGMPLYEVSREETVGNPDSSNLLIRGECLSACAYLKKEIEAGSMRPVDLVYIDPPFASGADYAKKVYIRRDPAKAAVVKEAEEQLDDEEFQAFEEKMYGDIWDKERYLNWMYDNLRAIKTVMSTEGSIFVHLDYHIGSYVKVLLDEVFGEQNFRSEIIWKRSTAHSDSAGFANLHDTIYFYSVSDEFTFNTQYVPYTEDYIENHYNHVDDDGRRWLDRDLSAKGLSGGGYTYRWKNKAGYWRCPEKTMRRYEQEGRLYYTRNSTPRYKQYLDDMPGMPAQDLWTDINAVNSQAVERETYATQKPEALLSRIVEASSNKGMLVADFFGGSGTTAAVCAKSGRNFIHADVGLNSIQTCRDRLSKIDGTSFDVLEVQDGVSLYRNPVQTMDKLRELIPGLTNEDSLDKFWEGSFRTSSEGMVPVYIPNLTDSTTKFLTKGLANCLINNALPDLPDGTRKVVVFYVDVDDLDGVKAFISKQNDTGIEIELRDLKPFLSEAVLEDDFEASISRDGTDLLNPIRVILAHFSSDRISTKIEEFNQRGILNSKKGFKPIVPADDGLDLIEMVSVDITADSGPWHSDAEVLIDKEGYATRDGIATGELWDGTLSCAMAPKRVKVRNICGDETIKVIGE
jgi:adenine-specific DNA-methyltransferase